MTTRRLALFACLAASPAAAGPDLIAADITGPVHFGQVGDVHAYSFAATACNLGDADLDWFFDTPAHPVIAHHLYRVHNGRLEQVGLSFANHLIIPLQSAFCSVCTPAPDTSHLGVGCSTADSAPFTAYQPRLAPRADVNASTGAFPFPFVGQNAEPADLIDRRLQVPESLLTLGDPYYIESQYVTADDATGGAGTNNASSRALTLLASLTFATQGATHRQVPAILAWAEADPDVSVQTYDVPSDGRFHVAAKAVPLGAGLWRYHYAIHNLNSHQSANGIIIPALVAEVLDPDFHAPLYHSGSPVDNDPWAFLTGDVSVGWFAPEHTNENDSSANALRWGTTYTFSLTAAAAPAMSDVTVFLFRPGAESSFSVNLPTPGVTCAADFAEPYAQLDFSDVVAFLTAFAAMNPAADLAAPIGAFDFSDVVEFLTLFAGGCP